MFKFAFNLQNCSNLSIFYSGKMHYSLQGTTLDHGKMSSKNKVPVSTLLKNISQKQGTTHPPPLSTGLITRPLNSQVHHFELIHHDTFLIISNPILVVS